MKQFFELLQVALGKLPTLSAIPTEEEWKQLYDLASKQAVIGVCFAGIEALPAEQRPPKNVLLQWFFQVQRIEKSNTLINEMSVKTCRFFENNGFKACVLKGQGNARMYPWPLRRQSGDIDVWVVPKADLDSGQLTIKKSRVEVLQWARKRFPHEKFDWKHIVFPIRPEVQMELHFVPTMMRSPWNNRILERFCEREAKQQMEHHLPLLGVDEKYGELVCPTHSFNLVFQLTHVFWHFVSEGVGMRQILDYYFLLQEEEEPSLDASSQHSGNQEIVSIVRQLGLADFAEGLMWVLHEVLGLEPEKMPFGMNEARGRELLDEIMEGGNFGHYESRYWQGKSDMYHLRFYVGRTLRLFTILRHYPSEILWDIPFRFCQRMWRWINRKP